MNTQKDVAIIKDKEMFMQSKLHNSILVADDGSYFPKVLASNELFEQYGLRRLINEDKVVIVPFKPGQAIEPHRISLVVDENDNYVGHVFYTIDLSETTFRTLHIPVSVDASLANEFVNDILKLVNMMKFTQKNNLLTLFLRDNKIVCLTQRTPVSNEGTIVTRCDDSFFCVFRSYTVPRIPNLSQISLLINKALVEANRADRKSKFMVHLREYLLPKLENMITGNNIVGEMLRTYPVSECGGRLKDILENLNSLLLYTLH